MNFYNLHSSEYLIIWYECFLRLSFRAAAKNLARNGFFVAWFLRTAHFFSLRRKGIKLLRIGVVRCYFFHASAANTPAVRSLTPLHKAAQHSFFSKQCTWLGISNIQTNIIFCLHKFGRGGAFLPTFATRTTQKILKIMRKALLVMT
ncbi:MAG: hypothetical protein K2H77_03470, partial [Alistipes sp.]|nr:hypothetical protein [Alistipes sp.]